MTFNDFIEEIRQRADIVDLVSDYVKLELKGKNYVGLCPFHNEKTPSFTVSRDKKLYYCFGCGAGGDIFNFLMEIENLPFFEAAKVLAERYGVPIPQKKPNRTRRKSDEIRDQLFEIHEWAAKFYQYLLLEHKLGKNALKYFEKRGFTRATIEKFRLGYAPRAWTALFHFLKKKGYPDYLLEKSGLVLPGKQKNGYYDRFRDRAIFTIFNLRGQPIGFGGRVMEPDQNPKYLNSPETPIFLKNQNLYGFNFAMDQIRKTGQAIIVEGYTDVITAHQYGIENVVASLGTSLTENQARLLARYAEEVYIAYDADTAGQKATLRGLDILKNTGLIVKVIELPDELDPDELIRKNGAEAFKSLLEDAISFIDFKLNKILKQYDLDSPDGKVQAVQELLPMFLNIDNAIEKDYLIKQIVKRVEISEQALKEELEHFIKEKSKIKDRNDKNWHTSKETRKVISDDFEAKFINAILRIPQMIGKIFEEITPDFFQNSDYRLIMQQIYLCYQQVRESGDFSLLTTNNLVENFSDNDLKKKVLELLFYYQDYEVTEKFIVEGLTKLKEYQMTMEMETILKKLKQIKNHGNLVDLNQILIRYHRLLHYGMERGGING
ncbi:DNA primase [Anoxybacter fermentans]|uniref:DNA primase n=1 Tax=Anoxybacter fermentans TaxID=1323375 RepID=UPI0013DF1E91|nr:DNA primase [Anoxybacter fermentans]